MINWIWLGLIVFGVIAAAVTGRMDALTKAAFDAAKTAVELSIGLIGIMILWFGLGEVFPRGEELIPLILRYIRYSLVGFWVTAGAPWLFFHFKLARPPKM